MDSDEQGSLDADKIQYAVNCMSYRGLQIAAALALVLLSKGYAPAEICRILEEAE